MKYQRVENKAQDFSTLAGAIFMASGVTRKECFKLKLFGLPSSQFGLVKRIKAGMILFLFDYDERKLYGVFEATSDGSMNIMPEAYASTGMQFPAQIQFKIIWKCSPMKEKEFRDSIIENYFTPNKFNFDLSYEQVMNLIRLFSSRRCTSARQHVHQTGKKHFELRGNYNADMGNMTHQSCLVEFDESENNRYNTTDFKDRNHTIDNKVDFSICSKSQSQKVEISKVHAPGKHAEDFYSPDPCISDFINYTDLSISNFPGEFPTSSPHLHHDYYLPSYLHEHVPTVSREINPSSSSTLADYRKSAIDTNSQYLGGLPYLAQHNSSTEFPPSACQDIKESIDYTGYRGFSDPIYKYSPASLTFAGSQSQGCDYLKTNYTSYSELCDHSALQDVVSTPRMLLSKGTDSLTSILGVSNDFPCYQSNPGILLTRGKDTEKSDLGMGRSIVSPQLRQTREGSRDKCNCNNYPCLSSYNLVSENKNMINYFDSSDLQRSSFRNSSLLRYSYPSTFEDCKDYIIGNAVDDMEASVIPKESEKNPCILNFTDKVHNEIQHYHTSQDEQEEYIPYPHHSLDNLHRRSSVFSRLSNVQKTQEIEELAYEPMTNPSVDELVEIMELRRKKWTSTSPLKKTIDHYSTKSQDSLCLEDSVHDPDAKPSTDKLTMIMELRRKKWGSNSLPSEKIINEESTKPQECLSTEANKQNLIVNLTGNQAQQRLSGKTMKSQGHMSPEKLYRVDPLANPNPQPESVPETAELPFVNFKRKSDVSKVSDQTQQTTHKRRKLIRPSFIQENNMNNRNTESPNVLSSSEVAAGTRSFLLGEEVHQSNPVSKLMIKSLENTATGEQKLGKSEKLARSSLTEVALNKGDSKNSEEVGDDISSEFQMSLPLKQVSQIPKNNAIDEGYKKAALFRSPLSKENDKISNISGSSEDVPGNGSLRTDLEVQTSIQFFPLIKGPKSAESPQGTTKRRKLAKPKETLITGDNDYANRLVCSQTETPDDDLVINDHEKTEAGKGTYERRKIVIPCLNEEDKLSKGDSKCSNVLGSSEIVAQRSTLFGNQLIEGPENTETPDDDLDLVINDHEKTEAGKGTYERRKIVIPCLNEEDKLSKGDSKCLNVLGSSEIVAQRSILFGNQLIEGPENTENENISHQAGLGNTGSAQSKDVDTSAINENVSNTSNELGLSMLVMSDNDFGAAEKLKEKLSNLVDRSATEEINSFSDDSPTLANLDTSMAEKPSEVI